MQLYQNGEFLSEIISKTENADPLPDRPQGILTARSTYTMVLQKDSGIQFSNDAQYAIQEDKKPNQSITIISAARGTVKYRHN
jgi:hypothetical protein